MVRTSKLIALVACASVLCLSACKSSHERGTQAHENHEGKEAGAGLELAEPATSLSAAIAIAQKSVPDGRFLVAKIDNEGGKAICIIGLACGDALRKINIDPATGAILASEDEKLDQGFKELLEQIGEDPKLAPIGAGQAIDAAMAKVPGAWACFAILGKTEGTLVYVVMVVDGKNAKLAQIAAADGNVQKLTDVALVEERDGHGAQ